MKMALWRDTLISHSDKMVIDHTYIMGSVVARTCVECGLSYVGRHTTTAILTSLRGPRLWPRETGHQGGNNEGP